MDMSLGKLRELLMDREACVLQLMGLQIFGHSWSTELKPTLFDFPSFHFSHSVLSESLRPHELQHARLAWPWPTLRVYSNSSIESVMPSNHLIFCRPLLLPPLIFPSIGVFSNESVLRIRWPEYWSFNFNISPFNAYSGLVSFRMDWVDLLAVQGTLKSLLQHYSSKASILQLSAFFIV